MKCKPCIRHCQPPRFQFREEKQHKHKCFGPNFLRTFLTLTHRCPGVKKFFPITGPQANTFLSGARTSTTRRFLNKQCPEENCIYFLIPTSVSVHNVDFMVCAHIDLEEAPSMDVRNKDWTHARMACFCFLSAFSKAPS